MFEPERARSTGATVGLGTVRLPSGNLVIVDAGYLGAWPAPPSRPPSWGDGLFPVIVESSANGVPVAVRVQLGDEERRRRTERVFSGG
jgi:hypothetical protein